MAGLTAVELSCAGQTVREINAALPDLADGTTVRITDDADVIIMGSRGRTDLAGMVLGSTAHKVIHLTDLPVLVVR